MEDRLRSRYRRALERLNVSDVARSTGRSRSALHAYLSGDRRVTEEAALELIAHLRDRAADLATAADELEAALPEEENDGDDE